LPDPPRSLRTCARDCSRWPWEPGGRPRHCPDHRLLEIHAIPPDPIAPDTSPLGPDIPPAVLHHPFMWQQTVAVVIQTLIVIAAFAALATSIRLARGDRLAAAAAVQWRWELDLLVRLVATVKEPGSSNSDESRRLSAERSALLSALGRDRLPITWGLLLQDTLEDAARYSDELAEDHGSDAKWARCKIEVMTELDRTRTAGPAAVTERQRML